MIAPCRLRLCQFNVLAPSARICSPLDRVPWQQRHEAICEFLLKQQADVVCLQEFDFEDGTPGFRELYEARLRAEFSFHCLQRTRSKPEGLAMLLRRGVFAEEEEVTDMALEPHFCDRVAQVARLQHLASGQRVLVANTHLTVAHASNSHDIPRCRPLQMEQVLSALELSRGPTDAVFLCADMNSDHLEMEPPQSRYLYSADQVSRPVHMAFERGFYSALHMLHQGVRPMSHTSSYSQDGCVDYVLFRPTSGAELQSAWLHPPELPVDTPWDAATGWGPEGSATLSDHRPLVVDFLLHGTGTESAAGDSATEAGETR